MRKLLPALLLCGTLLPGCVLAIGNGDDGKSSRRRLDELEQRVNQLERQLNHGQPFMHGNPGPDGHDTHDGPEMRD